MSELGASWLRQRLARKLTTGVLEEWQRISTAVRATFTTLNTSQRNDSPASLALCRADTTAPPAPASTSPAVLAASGHGFAPPEPHVYGFAAGALLATGAFALGTGLGGPVAECKSPSDPSDPSGGRGKPVGGEQADKVMAVWEGVEQEILRADAQLPAGCASTPLQAPEIKKAQGSTVVDVVVRQGVSLPHLERAILTLQPGLSTSSRHQSAKMQEDMSKKTVTVSQGNRSISLSLPKVSQGEARVSFWKQGEIDDGDLPVLGHIMSLANDMQLEQLPLQASPFVGFGSMESQSIDELLGMSPFGPPARDIIELFGRIRDEIEQDAKFMELGEEWTSEGFGMQHGQDAYEPENSPFKQLPPLQRQKSKQAAGTDSKMSWEQASAQLRNLGALVYLPDDEEQKQLDWSDMAGYDVQKRTVEDLVLMSVKHADEYERVAKQTRKDGKHQRPKAVLLEGPPGTGKTHVVRIVSSQASIPLVYIPLESTASKWYGESEKTLSQMLNLAERMGGCIIFLDEVDSLATKRADDMNEATRRLLGVLLRFIDGFKATDSIVIGATNRQEDLDTALLSRCQSIVTFGLPDEQCRAEILKHYAAHLKQKELEAIAAESRGMAARDLKAICEEAERSWVSSIIRGQAAKGSLPPLSAYTAAAKARASSLRMYA